MTSRLLTVDKENTLKAHTVGCAGIAAGIQVSQVYLEG